MRALRILLRWPFRAWLHRRCLRRIIALERALGIAYATTPAYGPSNYTQVFAPGVRWLVDDPRNIQIFQRPNGDLLKKEWLDFGAETVLMRDDDMRRLHARGLLSSGEGASSGQVR